MEKGENEKGELPFGQAVELLGATALRLAYRKEANSHRAMLERAKANASLIVHDSWRSEFRNFLRDMGPAPAADFTLDRIDTQRLEYGPGLCRWADKKTQAENRVNVRLVWLDGEEMTIAELARRANRPASSVYQAINAGKTPEEVMTQPGTIVYRPLNISPEEGERWHRSYTAWMRDHVHPSKRQYAPPEVFDLVLTSLRLTVEEKALSALYDNLTPDEHHRADEIRTSPAGQSVAEGNSRITHAVNSLAAWYPKLAARLTQPNSGFTRLTFWKWADWLKQPFLS